MDMQGPNLDKMLNLVNKPFSVDCVNLIALKLLSIIERTHQSGVIHTNLSPDKVLISRSLKDSSLTLIDFKEAKKVSAGSSNFHIN